MENRLIIVSGHSGAGKTTIMRKIMDNEVVSFATRPKREKEIDGKDYIFISQSEFDHLFNNNGLAEYTEYPPKSCRFYGIQKEEIDRKLDKGNAFVIVDYNGATQLLDQYKNTISIFIWCPFAQAKKRLQQRGEGTDVVKSRMETFWDERDNSIYYDYVVSNPDGKLDQTVSIVKHIIESRCN